MLTPYEGKKIRCGLSIEEYEVLLERQAGVCAICGRRPKKIRLNVDHDHAAEKLGILKVRGLLCAMCNHRVLGIIERLKVDPQAIVDYLSRAEGTALFVAGLIRARCSDVAPS